MTWGPYIIDAVFRDGDKHSNNDDTVEKMIRHLVHMICTRYSESVPIIIHMDSGFICSGKFYGDIKTIIESLPETAYDRHFTKTDEDVWHCFEFGDRRKSWRQFLLPGTHPGTLAHTNLGMGGVVDQQLRDAGLEFMLEANAIIHSYHRHGADELVHKAFYYTMLLGFFLFEAFKEDVSSPVVLVKSFPTRLRRRLVDVVAKVVSHAGRTLLKVTAVACQRAVRAMSLRSPFSLELNQETFSRAYFTGEVRASVDEKA